VQIHYTLRQASVLSTTAQIARRLKDSNEQLLALERSNSTASGIVDSVDGNRTCIRFVQLNHGGMQPPNSSRSRVGLKPNSATSYRIEVTAGHEVNHLEKIAELAGGSSR
jgi:hypothetical protein